MKAVIVIQVPYPLPSRHLLDGVPGRGAGAGDPGARPRGGGLVSRRSSLSDGVLASAEEPGPVPAPAPAPGWRTALQHLLATREDRDRPPDHRVAVPRNVVASAAASVFEAIFIPVLTELAGLHYMISVMSCMLVATTISFFLNKYWVFEARKGRTPRQYGRQLVLAAGSFVGNSSLIWLFTERLGLFYYLSWICSNVVIFCCWNYPGARWFVFRDGHKA